MSALPVTLEGSAVDTPQRPWRHAVPALALLVVWLLFIYRETGMAMVTIWDRSATFTHAFLVPPIVLWLVWRARPTLAPLTPNPSLIAVVGLAGFAFMWLLGDSVAVNSVTQFAIVALLVLAVPTVLGVTVARRIWFPLMFLFFAVPIGEFFMPQLMEWTADFTVAALRLSGIPVYREGLQFVIPSGNWSVVEACSGIRYLIASMTVGTLFAYLNYQSTRRRVGFIIVSILVPVVANWVRAYMIVMLGHLSGNKLAAGVDHLIYGWVFFGVVIMLMFLVGARWAEPEAPVSTGSAKETGFTAFSPSKLWAVTLLAAITVALPQAALWAVGWGNTQIQTQLAAPSVLNPGWAGTGQTAFEFKPGFQNPSAEVNTAYTNQNQTVGLYLGYYQNQTYERKLVSSENVIVSSSDPRWAKVSGRSSSVTLNGQPVAVRATTLRANSGADQGVGNRLLVWQIYWVNGTLTSNDYLAKLYGACYRLTGQGDASAAIIVYTSATASGDSDALLSAFMSANYAAIDDLLRQARQRKQ